MATPLISLAALNCQFLVLKTSFIYTLLTSYSHMGTMYLQWN